MREFLKKIICFSWIGGVFLGVTLVLYICDDPFKVIRPKAQLINSKDRIRISLNREFVSVQTLINNRKRIHYNAFILGNSRSIFYEVDSWKQHLDTTAVGYHLDASDESLWGINHKINFLDRKGYKIDYLLIVLDHDILSKDKPNTGHLFVPYPELSEKPNWFEFHKSFLFAFLNPKFLGSYIDLKLTHRLKPNMLEEHLFENNPITYNSISNEIRLDYFESLIRQQKYYTTQRRKVFYAREASKSIESQKLISAEQKKQLQNIARIVHKHHTHLKIIISPLYDQIKCNQSDLAYLKNVFKKENVFDFSGSNYITNNYMNYYENSHYRPGVSSHLMDVVYQNHP